MLVLRIEHSKAGLTRQEHSSKHTESDEVKRLEVDLKRVNRRTFKIYGFNKKATAN
ncbi:hypothetical protein N483_07165 [Pseudoalteromonas luteoviolacea NCIMB 1944]|uniref:Uncharacterized protein n=1 Tax=Pseudoalteromonas luteoviolacea (strain 2ta16) TaxID=1353533 RepID=V4JA92_PSEL2|nr:hypothetical protein [Pseudoalteromonas sp. Of7M-16]ESP92102.1 hypothetical protein PL2TA16_04938 [Pseudoalteromonas luteoviolacea 2ta16]KZN29205.1 hypothetical protein N483_07165 [Pseudoalteromonas luteoviolacea NCIMB 1944]MCG7546812.1 hypothetical protein [Pseudoalteromonas sp. Of7M-16]